MAGVRGASKPKRMGRRETWRPVLDAEVKRWSQLPLERLLEELQEPQACQVAVGSKSYTVEVELLENTDKYVHLIVAVDDGFLPWAMFPLFEGMIRSKTASP